jgi:AraC-like DNA-binding protein
VIIKGFFEAFIGFQQYPLLNLGISLLALLAASTLVIKSMRNPELFLRVNSEIAKLNQTDKNEDHLEKLEKLNHYMITEKPYLEETLSLQDLALQLDINAKHLSYLINQRLGRHFFDYINEYRIEESKKLLETSELTIQQIMYEVGFNSKSSFNTAFKKYTSITPSQFRKKFN